MNERTTTPKPASTDDRRALLIEMLQSRELSDDVVEYLFVHAYWKVCLADGASR